MIHNNIHFTYNTLKAVTYHIINIKNDWLTCHFWDQFLTILWITQTTGEGEITVKARRKHHWKLY